MKEKFIQAIITTPRFGSNQWGDIVSVRITSATYGSQTFFYYFFMWKDHYGKQWYYPTNPSKFRPYNLAWKKRS